MGIADLYQTTEWKKEKHVPVLEGPGTVPAFCNIHGLWESSKSITPAQGR